MKLEIGQRVIVDGEIWDAPVPRCYNFKNAEGYVWKLTSGWPLININGANHQICWEHIKTKEK
jgi:hypothetical protein